MNYSRKSTEGWSIAFAILDFLCGIRLLLEMLLVSYNYGELFDADHVRCVLCYCYYKALILCYQSILFWALLTGALCCRPKVLRSFVSWALLLESFTLLLQLKNIEWSVKFLR